MGVYNFNLFNAKQIINKSKRVFFEVKKKIKLPTIYLQLTFTSNLLLTDGGTRFDAMHM